ncbi:MAG: helix-hairpin-helix domain-containing protein [Chloroflexota bacterium]
MNDRHVTHVARELSLPPSRVRAAAGLIAGGDTIPFIARYRKEATGSLADIALARIRDRLRQLHALDLRRHSIVSSLEKLHVLTPTLHASLVDAETMAALEDLYLPFRPRRHTRASDAKARGLEPLARLILAQDPVVDPRQAARAYVIRRSTVARALRVPSAIAALSGARDIIAEWINDHPTARARIRALSWEKGILRSTVRKGKQQAGANFRSYFAWSRPVATAPAHAVLAVRRGEAAGFLSVSIRPPESPALSTLRSLFLKRTANRPSACELHVRGAINDGYRRLLAPAIETETRAEAKRRAEAASIPTFARNLRDLLLAPPLGQKRVLAVDPGLRTGCKLAILDPQGKLLQEAVIYPDVGHPKAESAASTFTHLVHTHLVQAIAIGSGTAGRQTATFVRSLNLPATIPILMVDESGASVYSTSAGGRKDLPHHDPTVRSAVSIGRRLIDPLAELVKLDPRTIGVGQYQHDVDPHLLARALDDVVLSCVNAVGVDLNTASPQLLGRVSGLGAAIAAGIVQYRSAHGPFKRRRDLMNVPRLGPKAFQQAAGFLRIRGASNPLDDSAVHPESYPIVDRMASDLGLTVRDLVDNPGLRLKIQLDHYVTDTVGLPTLTDILAELERPGRDPRTSFSAIPFSPTIHSIKELRPGMILPGLITNITDFGAFVDVGLKEEGLIHNTHLTAPHIAQPHHTLQIHQPIQVTVLEVDFPRHRISLSLHS